MKNIDTNCVIQIEQCKQEEPSLLAWTNDDDLVWNSEEESEDERWRCVLADVKYYFWLLDKVYKYFTELVMTLHYLDLNIDVLW